MKSLPKGLLKVIHVSLKAIQENELRSRATIGEPRRLVPPVTIWIKTGKELVQVEGFGVRIKGEVFVRYGAAIRLPLQYEGDTTEVRSWIETTAPVDLADSPAESAEL